MQMTENKGAKFFRWFGLCESRHERAPYTVRKIALEKTMNGGQKKLPTQVDIKLLLKFFEQKRNGMFQNKTIMRFHTLNSVNVKKKLCWCYFKNPLTVVRKLRRHFLYQKNLHDFFFRLKKIFLKNSLCGLFFYRMIGFLQFNQYSFLALKDCIEGYRLKVLVWNDRYFLKKLKQQFFNDLRDNFCCPPIMVFMKKFRKGFF